MRYAVLALVCLASSFSASDAVAQVPPEVDACRASGLAALKERLSTTKDLTFDVDGLAISKADTKVEDTRIKMVIMGDAYIERATTEKPNRFVCLVGEKGKVVLTFFTEQ